MCFLYFLVSVSLRFRGIFDCFDCRENNLKLKTAKLSSQLSADVNQGNTQTRTRIRIETVTVAFFAMADIAYTPSEPSQVSRRQPSVQTGSKRWQILMQPAAMAKNIRQRGTDS